MSSFSNNSGGSSSGATNAPLKEERKQSLQPCDRDNQLPTPAIIGRNETDQSRKTQNLLKSKKYETFDESSSRCEVGEAHVPPEPAAKKEVHFELPPSSRDHNEASAGFRSHYGTPSHQGKAYLETNLDSSCASERRSSTPTLNIAVSSCNEVGTSLWLTSGSGGSGSDFTRGSGSDFTRGSGSVGGSGSDFTRGAQTFGAQKFDAQKCDVFARGGRQDSPPPDYWNQVGQQVPFIDSSGGSARNSLLINQSATGGGSGYQILVDRSAVNQPPGSDSTSLNSAPSSPPPSCLTPPTTSTSFRDQSRKKRPKLSRFYSQHDPDCPPAGGIELRVLEPLLSEDDGTPIGGGSGGGGGSSGGGVNQLATVREGSGEGEGQRPGATRRELRKLKHSNTIACSGRKRKTSSWEESVSLQRRRSIASREEAREWRDKVLTAEGADDLGGTASTPPGGQGGLREDTQQDLRYYFQHPYLRLFATYTVIFCNFLLFAEDPISHSHAESVIPMVGNVFSFVLTKYPPEWRWALIKVIMWLCAIICGLLVGKYFVHNILCGKILRLKMFRDEQGSWIAMFLTVIVSLYLFSHVYNLILLIFYDKPYYFIDSRMGITYASVMKTAACGTWLGDLITALMVTDVMLQDNLYPEWAPTCRRLWRRSNLPRILIFWVVSVIATGIVVTLILSDYISWDRLNRDFISSTELTRAFLASFILVMDVLIMMQDWDFPHFTTTLHINLPGFSVATLEWKYAEVHLTGKWFNYGLIFMVMLLDLNMWKNQIFYYPARFGQYTAPDDNKIRTVNDQELLQTANRSLWTWESRSQINETTGLPYFTNDFKMNSQYMGYPLLLKITAFIPSCLAMTLFISVIIMHGRYPDQGSVTRDSEEITTSKKGVSV